MSEPGERPRWSFTWLVRVQRVGRNRVVQTDADGAPTREPILRRWAFIVVVFLLIVEIAVGIWLGYLPR